jgi:hypothetical protein
MLKKAWKTVIDSEKTGEINIYGNHKWIELEYQIPEWNEDKEDPDFEQCFKYKEQIYFLSEFMNIHNKFYQPNPPEWMKEFDGYKSDSYFSGLLIKISEDGEAVKIYTYIS